MPDSARIVIIGGGAVGLSVAYHLGKLRVADAVLLERNTLTSGTSWHAAGIIGPLRASMNLTKLSIYAIELLASLEAETGQATGYRQTGGLWLAQTPERMTELARIKAMGDLTGLHARIVTREETAELLPMLNVEDLAGALWVDEDGQANPVDTCMAYAKGARNGGVRIRESASVRTVHMKDGAVHSVELVDGEVIRCQAVINCTGVWAGQLGGRSGAGIPVQAVEHMYAVTEPIEALQQPFPIVRDLEGRIYIKEDTGKLVIGGFEADAKPWMPDRAGPDGGHIMLPEDWNHLEPFLTAALHRMPVLETAGIQHVMTGPEGFTPDTKQAMGELPGHRNYYVAAGFNSIGIISSAGVGKVMAEWIVDGAAPMDLWEVDVARFEPHTSTAAFLDARVREAVGTQFEMHWPHKQLKTGRNIKHSPLHEVLEKKGAVFGAPTGWERPLWYAASSEEAEIRYSYGDQPWWVCAERECIAVQERAALLELTPFGKFEIQGRDAEKVLQRLCANDVAVAPDQIVYTQMLNKAGGIEADVTVKRLADDRFWVIGGAPTRIKDRTWIKQHIDDDFAVVTDVTSAYSVVGLMGPRALDILQSVSSSDLSPSAFAFGTTREIDVGMAIVRASRVSFVGELGWELYVPNEFAIHVHTVLCQAGAAHDMGHMGLLAIDSCRIEKGFRHWGHDMGPEENPMEVGLSFAVAWDKSGEFNGRDALLRLRENPVSRRLVLCAVEGAHPLLLHDEPVYRNGVMVGRTTSGARGFRCGLSLCFASLAMDPAENIKDLQADGLEVSVAGETYTLKPLVRPPYDPDGLRMRA